MGKRAYTRYCILLICLIFSGCCHTVGLLTGYQTGNNCEPLTTKLSQKISKEELHVEEYDFTYTNQQGQQQTEKRKNAYRESRPYTYFLRSLYFFTVPIDVMIDIVFFGHLSQ
ncbi:hypothetical protein [Candidatus Uabimicrobium amorphum]|uniref:Lipoprotein n=1 Tax=Uabimicrobium amorphum TaxID=2596890 RepID=A0A5S9IR07_UABAM|nr:hypothetical protein [Candidatus Uabimicrobium amorphum]BBM85990.1 hypothetical protein UABAM_04376 [Candidatus Uabimicrobium amorphum]